MGLELLEALGDAGKVLDGFKADTEEIKGTLHAIEDRLIAIECKLDEALGE